MSDRKELKPCPFCGGKSVLAENHNSFFYTGCCDCGASHEPHYVQYYAQKGDLVKVWNHRPIEDALRAESQKWENHLSSAEQEICDKECEIEELEKQLAEARKVNLRQLVKYICGLEYVDSDNIHTYLWREFHIDTQAIDFDSDSFIDDVVNWLIEQGVEGDRP